jgi:hypothetical protein
MALASLNKQIHLHFVSRKEKEAHCMRLSGHDVSGTSPHFRSILVFEMKSELRCWVLFAVGFSRGPRMTDMQEHFLHFCGIILCRFPRQWESVFQILRERRHVGVSHLEVRWRGDFEVWEGSAKREGDRSRGSRENK